MSKHRPLQMAAVTAVLFLAVAVGTCGPTTDQSTSPAAQPTQVPADPWKPEVVSVTPEPAPGDLECAAVDPRPIGPEGEFACAPAPPATFFAPDHVIVTGPESEIDGFVQEVANVQNLRFTAVHQLCLTYVDDVLNTCPYVAAPNETLAGVEDPHFVVRLYRVEGCFLPDAWAALDLQGPVPPEVQAMVLINLKAMSHDPPIPVAADLSYAVGGPTYISYEKMGMPSGSEWMGAGSPWASTTIPPHCSDPATAFSNQWIWGAFPGINLEGISGASGGESVRVGLFDTSPWLPSSAIANWGLRVEALPYGPLYNFPEGNAKATDHGAFVAALLHATAPGADIRLYPVLDDYAHGDLYTLDASLHHFVQQAIYDRSKATVGAAVINLSLGIHSPQDVVERSLAEPDWAPLGLSRDLLSYLIAALGDRARAPSLRLILGAAKCHGIPTVAAAGNDSAESPNDVPAQIPAAFADISLAVGSSNAQGKASCFSNQADILAPGGEGCVLVDSLGNCLDCQPVKDCNPQCQITLPPAGQAGLPACNAKFLFGRTSHGYVYWAGTSFSTPLVTGVVARFLGQSLGAPVSVRELADVAFDRVSDCAESPHLPSTPPLPLGAAAPIVDAIATLGMSTCP